MSWINEVDEDASTLFDRWKRAIYKSQKMHSTDSFLETAWYYIDQIENDEYIPEGDTRKLYEKRMKR